MRNTLSVAKLENLLRGPLDEGFVILIEGIFANHAHSLELRAEVKSTNERIFKAFRRRLVKLVGLLRHRPRDYFGRALSRLTQNRWIEVGDDQCVRIRRIEITLISFVQSPASCLEHLDVKGVANKVAINSCDSST